MPSISNNSIRQARALHTQICWQDFFNNSDIDRIVEECCSKNLQTSTLTQNGHVKKQIRTSNINFHYPNQRNSWIFERINFGANDINSKFYHFDLYGYDSFQYSEYRGLEGGKYDFHMDVFTDEESLQAPMMRKLSLVLLLSEPGVDFEGGEFQMNTSSEDKLKTLEMRKGTLIAFPSFMIHRVTPVTKGIRRSIVVWVEGPKFK